jgi:hypothetical protein
MCAILGQCCAYQLTRKVLFRADVLKNISFERAGKTEFNDQISTETYFQVPSKKFKKTIAQHI